jgi:5-methylcytosine-specific restriction endonuclease McrA
MDHIKPVVSMDGFKDIWEWADNLFCDKSNWQRLCSVCHEKKTTEENAERNKNKLELFKKE